MSVLLGIFTLLIGSSPYGLSQCSFNLEKECITTHVPHYPFGPRWLK